LNNEWVFPKDISNIETNCNSVYNLVLDNNHTIVINNCITCTLWYNITENEVIKHDYFGTDKVINDLKQIEGFNNGYVELNIDDFIRNDITNKINKIYTKHS